MDHDCLDVTLVALFHLGGHIMCPSLVLSLLGNMDSTGGFDRGNILSPPHIINTLSS
jgi:hypothetical protein